MKIDAFEVAEWLHENFDRAFLCQIKLFFSWKPIFNFYIHFPVKIITNRVFHIYSAVMNPHCRMWVNYRWRPWIFHARRLDTFNLGLSVFDNY